MAFTYVSQSPFPKDGFFASPEFPSEEAYTGLKMLVMGQLSARLYQPSGDEVCISITPHAATGLPRVTHAQVSDAFMDVLRLQFDDTAIQHFGDEDALSISAEQADLVAEFVGSNLHRKVLVVHCFAGISRSRSMAAAIADYYELPYDFTVRNEHVYNMVIDAFIRRDTRLGKLK